MSEHLIPIPLNKLLKLIFNELDNKDSYFGIPSSLFFNPSGQKSKVNTDLLTATVFGKPIQTPLGIAAGPHSQMAQNIVAAWLLGARYIELKTVQHLDELDIDKPCIDMEDEGYNCEWSQELNIRQSFEEYLHAWIIIHILNHRFGRVSDPGVLFNISVGYDMEGILNEKVQWFLSQMEDCSDTLQEKINQVRKICPDIDKIDIPAKLSNNVTLSTMHGCPAGEIEDIAGYLMKEKGLHTYVKLNPTLLGSEKLRFILNDKLGFTTTVSDQAFAHDLQYDDALGIIENLLGIADQKKLEFGLKMTNTLESVNHKTFFSESIESMYMSGRALHPLAVNLAAMLQDHFDGRLALSFSGGADAFNSSKLLASGFKTVTTCTDLLKPGGMMRLPQYLEQIARDIHTSGAETIAGLIVAEAKKDGVDNENADKAALNNLKRYADQVLNDPAYKRKYLIPPDIKTKRPLGYFDCIAAPCRETCATNQDIPEYMHFTAEKDYQKAHETILRTNPFPAVTGMICDHLCQDKCTRVHYDDPLLIREVKRFISGQDEPELSPAPSNNNHVSIIGAGPAGLSCAYFLALSGCPVDVYESTSKAGGMIRYAIPGFRLTDEAIDKDLQRIESLGVRIHFDTKVDKALFQKLRETSDHIFVGAGAPLSAPLPVEGKNAKGVMDPLDFLFRVRAGEPVKVGRHVVIIGGGNTAMDAARTANRLVEECGRVTIVYRRTIYEMPADQGEIEAAIMEGVRFLQKTGPEKIETEDGKVTALQCTCMELKAEDDSGRPKPVRKEKSEFSIACDTIIPAVGQVVDVDFLTADNLETGNNSYLVKAENVFIGGDLMRGASTAINAIGDGRKAAQEILQAAGVQHGIPTLPKTNPPSHEEIMLQRARREFAPVLEELPLHDRKNFKLVQHPAGEEAIVNEARRCLQCDELCNSCVTVCPNLANYAYTIEPLNILLQKATKSKEKGVSISDDDHFTVTQTTQILNIANFCNACGNCHTFCPTESAPYKEKPSLHLSIESFYASDEGYYLSRLNKANNLIGKKAGELFTLSEKLDTYTFETKDAIATLDKKDFHIRDVHFLNENAKEVSLWEAAAMLIILEGAKQVTP